MARPTKGNSIGEVLKTLGFAFGVGELAAIVLLYHGYNSEDLIFGASLSMTRAFVAAICWLSCCVAEAISKSSAQEILADGIISVVVSILFVKDGTFLIEHNMIGSVCNMLMPIAVSLIAAAILSYYLARIISGILSWIPFKKNEEKEK